MGISCIWRKSIRARLLVAFAMVALPVVVTGLSSSLRHPAQFSYMENQLASTHENIQVLQHGVGALGQSSTDKKELRVAIEPIVERLRSGKIQGALAGELLLSLEMLLQKESRRSRADERSLTRLLRFSVSEQEHALYRLADELLQTTHRVQRIQTAQTGIAVLMVVLLSSLLSKHFSKPLWKLKESIAAIQSGNLGVKTNHHSDDEIGLVLQAFDTMSDQLKENLVSRSFLSAILSSLKEAVVVCSTTGEIEFCNSSFAGLAGISLDSLDGASITAFLPGYQIGTSSGTILKLRSVNGESIPVSLLESRFSENGSTKLAISLMDERQRLQILKDQDATKRQLAHSERLAALGTLSGEVAHRLNQPLTSLRLFLQQARRSVQSDDVNSRALEGTISLCLDETVRASNAVKSILQYTRREPGTREQIQFSDLIAESAAVLHEMAQQQDVQLELENQADVSFYCVAEELREVLFILVDNAFDALRGASVRRIHISTSCRDGGLELSVEDTGTGLSEDEANKIFAAFYTTKPNGQGTGLGLSIARKIVEDHNGKLKVEAGHNGSGCRFVIRFHSGPVGEGVRV